MKVQAATIEACQRIGMTVDEMAVFMDLGELAGRILALPEVHPSDKEEHCRDIHNIQNRLLARPFARFQYIQGNRTVCRVGDSQIYGLGGSDVETK